MQNQKMARLSWVLCAFVILMVIFSLIIDLSQNRFNNLPALANQITFQMTAIVSAVVGALIVSHQPRNVIGWLLLFYPVVGALAMPLDTLVKPALLAGPQTSLGLLLVSWFDSWSWWLFVGPIFLIPLLFPTGRLLSPRWRWVVAGLAFCFAFFLLVITFGTTIAMTGSETELPNPIGFIPPEVYEPALILFQVMLVGVTVCSFSAIFVRFRRASTVEREQVKWLLYACSVFLVVYLSNFNSQDPAIVEWSGVLFNIVTAGIPAAIGAAILRYHLWDIDILIRRTISYTLLTALLALVYFGGVTLIQGLFWGAGGRQSPLAILASTLLIAALFNPLRRSIQEMIDRRFYRQKYNAEQAVARFVGSARSQADLETLAKDLVQVTQQTLEPKEVQLWLRKR